LKSAKVSQFVGVPLSEWAGRGKRLDQLEPLSEGNLVIWRATKKLTPTPGDFKFR
jgi:hypothetical protein